MRKSRSVALCSLMSVGVACSSAIALAQDAQTQDFSTLRFAPAPGPQNYFQVDGARVSGQLSGAAGFVLDYAHQPFTLYPATCDADGSNCTVSEGDRVHLVEYTAAAHLWGSIAIGNRVQIGLVLPLVYTEGQAFQPTTDINLRGGSAFAVGDPRLHLKVDLLDEGVFHLGAAAYVTAPVAHQMAAGRYIGDETPTFGGHVIAEVVSGGFRVAGNVGGVWRDGQVLFSTQATSQLTYGLGLGYDITPLFGLFGEVVGATSFSSAVDENALEGRGGARLRVGDFVIDLGGGGGVIGGVGVPLFRGLGSFAWAPVSADSDNDRILDANDACPSEAEDFDEFDDADGCPEADNDGDSIPDATDRCPDAAEDLDGEEDDDGCPDMDTDGDGVQDGYDSCPTEAEDMDGDRDDDGCPDNDRDHDHINDDVDQCPADPEDTDGYGDEDGCPETDFDGDTLPDDGDACPDQAEDADGFEDEDGCPEEGGPPTEEPAAGHRHHTRGR